MGYRDSFSEAGIITKIAFFVGFVSVFCSWVSFTTTSWFIGSSHLGLWRLCSDLACQMTDGASNVDYGVTQAFAIIGFMAQNVGFLLLVFFIFKNSCRGNSDIAKGSAILFLLSAFAWLIAVAVFGGKFDDYQNGDFDYSYGLAVVACFLGIFSGVLMFLGAGSGSVGSK